VAALLKRHLHLAAYLFLLAALAFGAYLRQGDVDQIRANQKQLSAQQGQIERIAITNCQQVEKLKAQVRRAAIDSYRHLEQNARILMIEVTPTLRRVARERRDRTLRRYAARDCGLP
jgi:hypothetical protein